MTEREGVDGSGTVGVTRKTETLRLRRSLEDIHLRVPQTKKHWQDKVPRGTGVPTSCIGSKEGKTLTYYKVVHN